MAKPIGATHAKPHEIYSLTQIKIDNSQKKIVSSLKWIESIFKNEDGVI